ncbi:glycerate kinase [Quadrisphaera setariae]|uniref:Glycerate kinase n=1 Tax=Quadrisphaera setariae TaxID=2593304 RepID=A0A5C8Z3V0_9ACTN|nr:glycerate kinase [Quadrisphaera setariae]TXR52772.1 glycerate kinase [Quadrisphaera setariae]
MRVLVAPDGFTGTLTAPEAARALADGWLSARPGDEVDLCPLSDGGPGFLDVLEAAAPASRRVLVETTGPLGEPVSAPVLLLEGATTTAAVESALACGTALLPPGPPAERDALAATTAGVGALLAAARAALPASGSGRVLVGLGGSATTDGGAGALAALAGGAGASRHLLARGGGALRGVRAGHLPWLPALRASWSGVDLVAATDVDVPLLGPHGAAHGFGPQKGASPADEHVLEEALAAWREAVEGADPTSRGLAEEPGAGAAGGLGYGLLVLGGRRQAGARAVAEAVDLAQRAAAADVLLTGEGCLDWQSLRGKVVAQVAEVGTAAGTPVVVVAGQVRLDAALVAAGGLALAQAVVEHPRELEASLAAPASALAARTAQVALTWPRRA